jgi:hypothetical protein
VVYNIAELFSNREREREGKYYYYGVLIKRTYKRGRAIIIY